MSTLTTCRKCGVAIQSTTAESTGGFCKPCQRWVVSFESDVKSYFPFSVEQSRQQIALIRTRAFEKVGVTQDPNDGNDFKVLSGFLSSFVRLNLKLSIPEMLVRCRNEVRDRLRSTSHAIKKSDRMRWNDLDGWDWTDVLLDGSLDNATLLELVDESYDLTCQSLQEDERECLSLLSKDLEPPRLFDAMVQTLGLARRREQILATKKSSFVLKTSPLADGRATVGSSRIGGLPDLPKDIAWPQYKNGKPLAFLAQINLGEIPSGSPLPESGILWFFSVFGWQTEDDADPQLPPGKYADNWTRVIYQDVARENLRQSRQPDDVNTFPPASIEYVPIDCFPSHPSEKSIAQLKWKSDVKEKYLSLVVTYNMAVMQKLGNPSRNLLFGYADFEQELVRQVAKDDLHLLFQLGSDPNARMSWGDGGYIYFWARADDLIAGRFDRVFTDHQCG